MFGQACSGTSQTTGSFRQLVIAAVTGLLVLLSAPAIHFLGHSAEAQATAVFSRIDVAGNQRISADTVRSIAGIEPGVATRPAEINAAFQRLFDSDLFEDVELRPEGGRLVIQVVERPTINQIAIEGNSILSDDILLGLVTSQVRQTFSPAQAEADAQAMIDAYITAGRLSAQVAPRIIERSENRVDLVFEVFEGEVVEIARVGFIGNHEYSDRRLRRVLATKQANLLSFLFRSDTYIEDRIALDRQLLEEFYSKRGFIDFEILSVTSELTQERDAFLLTFRLREGNRFEFGNVRVTTELPEVELEEFRDEVNISPGETYDAEVLERLLDRLNLLANEMGLAFVETAHTVNRNSAEQTVDVDIRMVRGPRLFVERIDIRGNSTTLDHVIRRQFRIAEGDPFNRREIQRATDRIRALRYFRNVSVEARPGSTPEQAIIDVVVEEQPTGSLTFGIAYATDSGVGGNVTLTERNFRGRGQTIYGSLSTSSANQHFSFGFVEPAVLDRDLLFGVDLYHRINRSDAFAFEATETGVETRLSFPVSENARLAVDYELSHRKLVSRSSATVTASSPFVSVDLGKSYTSAVGVGYALNTTDSIVDPTRGYRLRVRQVFCRGGAVMRNIRIPLRA